MGRQSEMVVEEKNKAWKKKKKKKRKKCEVMHGDLVAVDSCC